MNPRKLEERFKREMELGRIKRRKNPYLLGGDDEPVAEPEVEESIPEEVSWDFDTKKESVETKRPLADLKVLEPQKPEIPVDEPFPPPPLVQPVTPDHDLTLHDAYQFFKDPMKHPGGGYVRIVGEEQMGVCLSLILCENGSFGIEGPSGSSKTLHMNKVLELLPSDQVYVASQITPSGLFEDCEAINGLDYLIFTELQKVTINGGLRGIG
jgi:hypothetical protein